MTTTQSSRSLSVTVEFAASPETPDQVTGIVSAPGQEPVFFAGWIALLELLEAVATSAAPGNGRST